MFKSAAEHHHKEETRYVLGFPMSTGQCTDHSLDHMCSEITAWLKENKAYSWLVVRRGQPMADHLEVDYSAIAVQRGPVIGSYMGEQVLEYYVCADGSAYEYTGVINDMRDIVNLEVGMRVMVPGLLYKECQRVGGALGGDCLTGGFLGTSLKE